MLAYGLAEHDPDSYFSPSVLFPSVWPCMRHVVGSVPCDVPFHCALACKYHIPLWRALRGFLCSFIVDVCGSTAVLGNRSRCGVGDSLSCAVGDVVLSGILGTGAVIGFLGDCVRGTYLQYFAGANLLEEVVSVGAGDHSAVGRN